MGESDCKEFLREAKQLVAEGNREFIKRTYDKSGAKIVYFEALLRIGFTEISQAWNEVLKLNPDHYFRGPRKDYNPRFPGNVWEFKKDINGMMVYIKLKIDARGCVCMSFHEDW